MKKIRTNNLIVALLAIVFTITTANAQAPQAIPYQAAARNSSGVIITNKTIALRFTLHDASTTGTIVYQEKQNAVTNALGMFIVNIGQGIAVTGTFSNINWSVNGKFMQVELDTTATGNSYTDMGTQQLMSVPYALNATKADNGVPVGTVVAFMGTTPPAGWLLCDYTAVSRSTYANLFSVIGIASGKVDGSTTFNLPELRGEFLRGKDGGSGNDPDAATRLASYSNGGNSGDAVGSWEPASLASHSHFEFTTFAAPSAANPKDPATNSPNYTGQFGGGDPNSYFMSTSVNGGQATSYPTSNYGGKETRPHNISVNWIIKY